MNTCDTYHTYHNVIIAYIINLHTSRQNVFVISSSLASLTFIFTSWLPSNVFSGFRSVIVKLSVKLYSANFTPRSSALWGSVIEYECFRVLLRLLFAIIHYIGVQRHMICIPCWVAFSWLVFESFWVLTSFEPVKLALIVDSIESVSEVSLLFLYPFCSYVVQSTSKYTYGK